MDIIFIIDMSFSQQSSLKQFIPTYVVKSDYLPTVVQQGQNATTADLVHL